MFLQKPAGKELSVPANMNEYLQVKAFIGKFLDALSVSENNKIQIIIAADELFSNIVNHSNIQNKDIVTVIIDAEENPDCVVLTFIYTGVPFDPFSVGRPNLTASAKDRKVGGLGLFMVKKIMDDFEYEYKNGQNIQIIRKYINKREGRTLKSE